jgi:heme-degrading monooxygenase HmoA
MFVVLFEVQPKRHSWDRYLELAGLLRPELLAIPGFVDNERYTSERSEDRVLSLSTWESEKALIRWRTHARHHDTQGIGRFEVFENYHLRVGEVVSDSAHGKLPATRLDQTEVSDARAVTISETPVGEPVPALPPATDELVAAERFESITSTGKQLLLASWRSIEGARVCFAPSGHGSRHRYVRVIRDYGMHEREEAPQFYPPVEDHPVRHRL